jgi:CHASE2 domain-containing sensor protein
MKKWAVSALASAIIIVGSIGVVYGLFWLGNLIGPLGIALSLAFIVLTITLRSQLDKEDETGYDDDDKDEWTGSHE